MKLPKRPAESRQKVVKRRRIVNNNDDYEYDLGRIKQAKKTTFKPVEQPLQKDQAFYVRILKIFLWSSTASIEYFKVKFKKKVS